MVRSTARIGEETGEVRPLHVVFTASETLPFQKTGGLADVTASLPRELARLGHRVEIFLPLYLKALLHAIDQDLPISPAEQFPVVRVRLSEYAFRSRVYTTTLPDSAVQVHLVDSETYQYFTSRSVLASPYSFRDNASRFAFFSKVVAQICALRPDRVDVVHAHDWPTGLVPLYLSTEYEASRIASVFTIHNLGYTCSLPPERFHELTRLEGRDHPGLYGWEGRGIQHHGQIDLLKAGIVRADMVNTVSPSYAREILRPEHGGDYAGTLGWIEARGQLEGILNGVDDQWRPAQPPREFLPGKRACKLELQRAFSLAPDETAFVAVMTSRLAGQKGYQLLPRTLALLREQGVRLQLLAAVDGEEPLRRDLLAGRCAEIEVRHLPYNEDLTRTLVYPGADCLLMPSLYEPCGLSQIIAQLNGTLPVVFATGGLKDTVREGQTGFVFHRHQPEDFADAVARAWHTFRREPARWAELQRQAMALDYSWRRSARAYEALYRRAMRRAASPRRYS